MTLPPLLILAVGMTTVIGGILVFRLHAFLALIGAAIIVSLLAPGETAVKITRVAEALGATAGNIGIVIALAAVIGKAMLDSGAADRIVRGFLSALGENRGGTALVSSGYVLAIPVFFDTVFYLLVPLARSMYRRTGRHYLKFIMAVAAGGAATHNLVPPTPGPLIVAGTLGIDLGTMLLMGVAISIPAAAVGLAFAAWVDRRMPIIPAEEPGSYPSEEPALAPVGPGLFVATLPIVLPVLLISTNTVVGSLASGADARPDSTLLAIAPYVALVGNANMALLISAIVALWVYAAERRPSRAETASLVEESLMSAGVIILITAAGGAFGAMLRTAEIGPAIARIFEGGGGAGLMFLFLGFGLSTLLKIAQGSSTVANITTAGMVAAMLAGTAPLPFHTVYVGTAIASGALVGSWMNDSGFWIFSRMGGLTELETLKSWTPLLAIIGITSMIMTVALAVVLPLR